MIKENQVKHSFAYNPLFSGLNVILVQVRMPLAAQENSPHLKTLWTTLKMYCAVVDYMILKYKICAAVSNFFNPL